MFIPDPDLVFLLIPDPDPGIKEGPDPQHWAWEWCQGKEGGLDTDASLELSPKLG